MASLKDLRNARRRAMRLVRFSRRTDVAGARGLALDYAKLRVMEALVPQWRRPVRLAGFTVHYTDLASLRWLFKEIFVHRDYEPPSGTEVRSIVDAGANVGWRHCSSGIATRTPRS